MTTLDQYFQLSDSAGADEIIFEKLINLFSEQAVLKPAGAKEIKGKEAIRKFFKEFFRRNEELHHVWQTQPSGQKLETTWAVSGRRIDGEIFCLKGIDIAELDEMNKIRTLEVQFKIQ
ncbi:nuclear transport factor 2 family protein [Desulfitobacterium sp.]|uniref:nuclear transport factor 2 family protein n=1 Tax=Desulfitobacterium sp. TaxID=49981 RepID=UPI002B20DC38|nr:nuclear transport factor 2 family protein [Desulfitobacterium sp.]MEA4901043.1 nuclear transport factor 2 family protein [Desulfitobacterium sp.]